MSVQDKKINLVINNLSKEKYAELKRNNLLCAELLYLVNDDTLDAGNSRVVNVANPTSSSDATNKNYVDLKVSNIKNQLSNDGYITSYNLSSEMSAYLINLSQSQNEINTKIAEILAKLGVTIQY